MWARDSRTGAGLDPEAVARSLQDVLAPLFTAPPPVVVEANAAAVRPGGRARARGPRRAAAARDCRPSTGKPCYDYDLHWDEVGGPLPARLTRDDGPWTDVFDGARVRGGAGTAPVEVALVALVAQALAPADA